MRRGVLRLLGGLLAVALGTGMLCVPAFCDEAMPEGFSDLAEILPDEERALLDEELFSENAQTAGKALEQMLTPSRLFGMAESLTERAATGALSLLATLTGLLMISAVLTALSSTVGSAALGTAVRFCTTVAIFAAILSHEYGALLALQVCLERLCALVGMMIPIAGSVWAMGGNIGTATAGTGVLSVFLTITEHLLAASIVPVCSFCMAAALCGSIGPEPMLRGVSAAIKKGYTFLLGLVMSLLLFSLSATTALSASADSMAARTAKLVSATVIPTVGGSVGETLRTVAASVQYLKGVVGFGGILLVLLLTLPMLLSLIGGRLAFLLAGGLAELLGCDNESKLLGELGSVFGCMIAVCAMSGVMFILALTVFVKSTVAVA